MAPATPLLKPEQIAANMSDLEPRYTANEAVTEASRCLYCFDAPCTRACPTHIDIPKFIRQILHRNPVGAAKTILTENILGGSCARACPTEVLCEGACVDMTLLKEPVRIGRLQRFACDEAHDRGMKFFEAGKSTGKRIAVIGAGPAGLSCAHEARKAGHDVDVFEARDIAGGLNTLGIAPYKISTEFALTEIELVKQVGVKVHLNSPVNAAKMQELRSKYDAVFLGVGLGHTARLAIEGEELQGVWESLDFIFQQHRKPLHECTVGRRVVVIGAGNTAVDVATEAHRLGAEFVAITYRRSPAEMTAYQYEFELAKGDAVQFHFHAQPLRFVGEGGRLTGVQFIRTEMVGSGRTAELKPVAGSEFIIPCDMAIKALGQEPILELLKSVEGLKVEGGKVWIDRATMETSVPGLYAGGDCTSKGAEIVNAVQEGKVAARAMSAKWSGA